ncbi:MAG: lipocalin-like domain-containing protein [Aquabacterium sp.]
MNKPLSKPMLTRRQLLCLMPTGLALWQPPCAQAAEDAPPVIRPDEALRFPLDFGAHPAYRTEWWYITGQLTSPRIRQPLGFQITFFRSRVDTARASGSRFATRQLVFAHTALSDVDQGKLMHDQRIARVGFGLSDAAQGDTRITLRDWTLQRSGTATHSVYQSHVAARDFTLDLRFTQTQALLQQGDAGFSRKAPGTRYATHYYTQPQLQVQGRIQYPQQAGQQTLDVQGTAWLDHEWGETLLAPDTVGWDWVGINLHNGATLTAFRLRRKDGSTLWSGGSLRQPGQASQTLTNGDVRFTPGRIWTSPATGARYPVEWAIDLPGARYTLRARFDQQELDSRHSTGNVYWEGLSELRDAQGQVVGSGYLEMTGYVSAMTL